MERLIASNLGNDLNKNFHKEKMLVATLCPPNSCEHCFQIACFII